MKDSTKNSNSPGLRGRVERLDRAGVTVGLGARHGVPVWLRFGTGSRVIGFGIDQKCREITCCFACDSVSKCGSFTQCHVKLKVTFVRLTAAQMTTWAIPKKRFSFAKKQATSTSSLDRI